VDWEARAGHRRAAGSRASRGRSLVQRDRSPAARAERGVRGVVGRAAGPLPRDGTRYYDHPEAGRLSFDYTILDVADERFASLHLVFYPPTPGR
jgi:hypothetical protein